MLAASSLPCQPETMSNHASAPGNVSWHGPLLVALGAVLWATDSLFRSDVIRSYSPLFIVFFNHALCLGFALPALATRRRDLQSLERREILALTFIATCGSVLAAVMFTQSFATTTNFTTPILIQKLQPLFAIVLARLILKERMSRRFPIWAALAVVGTYLVTFGLADPWTALATKELVPALYAAGAAAIWGATTVAGRLLLGAHDHLFVTAARFTFATIFVTILVACFESFAPITQAFTSDLQPFAMMAIVSGMLPLGLYYYGLKTTPASTATLCELAFPLSAILLNWIFLDQPLTVPQLGGAILLVSAITALSYENTLRKTVMSATPLSASRH